MDDLHLIELEREKFENYYSGYFPQDSPILYFSRDDTGYILYETRLLWQGWLARASQQEAEGFRLSVARIGSEATVRAPNPIALQLRECLYRLRDKSA